MSDTRDPLEKAVDRAAYSNLRGVCRKQEDTIARLTEENARLRAVLEGVVEAWDWWQVDTYDRCASVPRDAIMEARAALAAGLAAWPGVCVRTRLQPDPKNGGQWILPEEMLSLPLTQEDGE